MVVLRRDKAPQGLYLSFLKIEKKKKRVSVQIKKYVFAALLIDMIILVLDIFFQVCLFLSIG